MIPMQRTYLLLLAVFVLGCSPEEKLGPVQLTCEYLEDPAVVDLLHPRLSWINQSVEGERGQVQTAWQIRVASSKEKLDQPLRIIEIECTPHIKPSGKTGRGGPEQGDTILIVTDRVDLPPDVVALLYKHRWQVEIFFRFFKHILGCRHLLSHCDNGIELETYAAIIACLLIALWTGRKPRLSTYRMLCWYFTGWADEEELLRHINKLKQQDVLEKII